MYDTTLYVSYIIASYISSAEIWTGNVIVWEFLTQESAVIGSMWGYKHVGICTDAVVMLVHV